MRGFLWSGRFRGLFEFKLQAQDTSGNGGGASLRRNLQRARPDLSALTDGWEVIPNNQSLAIKPNCRLLIGRPNGGAWDPLGKLALNSFQSISCHFIPNKTWLGFVSTKLLEWIFGEKCPCRPRAQSPTLPHPPFAGHSERSKPRNIKDGNLCSRGYNKLF